MKYLIISGIKDPLEFSDRYDESFVPELLKNNLLENREWKLCSFAELSHEEQIKILDKRIKKLEKDCEDWKGLVNHMRKKTTKPGWLKTGQGWEPAWLPIQN